MPFIVPGLSTSSSSSSSHTSPTSSSQETVTPTEYPASTRSESMSEEVRGNSSHGPAETEKPNKNHDNEEVRGNSSLDLPEWLEEFRHNLVDESVPKHRDASSSSHELPSEPRTKVSIRCSGTRLGNTVDTIIPMTNKNFSGNIKELTKVPGADQETKSHLHWQFPRLWQIS